MRLAYLALGLVGILGCVQSNTVQCGDHVCPAETTCDDVHDTCVKPAQLHSCVGMADGEACAIEAAGDGICDQNVCVIERCGDGYIRGGEQCDGAAIPAGANCTDLNFYVSATPTCTPDCTFDLASCEQRCGDGTLQPEFEICETTTELTKNCVDFGFGAGELSCINCGPETSQCIPFGWELMDVHGGVNGLHGTSATDVYALVVGGLDHYDGTTWTQLDLASCGLTSSEPLEKIWAPAPGVVFAEGGDAVIRIMGGVCTKWVVTGNTIYSLYAASATDAWVSVNAGGIYRLNGATWTLALSLPGPNDTAHTVWGSSASDVYTLSYDGTVRRYNGTSWSSSFTVPGLNQLSTIWGTGPSDIYVGGQFGTAKIVRYNGSTWKPVLDGHPMLTAANSFIYQGMTIGGHTVVLAYTSQPTRNIVMLSDGAGWVNLEAPIAGPAPMWVAPTGEIFTSTPGQAKVAIMRGTTRVDRRPGVGGTSVTALAMAAPDEAYAAVNDTGTLEHWDGNSWAPTAGVGSVYDVTVAPSGNVIAFGASGLYVKDVLGGGAWSQDATVSGDHVHPISDTDLWLLSSQNAGSAQLYHSSVDIDPVYYPTTNSEQMQDLWGTSSMNMYLVGAEGNPNAVGSIYHYNGTTYQHETLPAGIGPLARIIGHAANDIYVIGQAGELIHFNGTTWSEVDVPGSVNDVAWTGPMDVFATTYTGLLHYDGTGWLPVSTGAPVGVSRIDGSGSTLTFVDYFGDSHQLVRTRPW